MKLTQKLIAFALLLVVLLLPVRPVAAAGSEDGKVVIGDSFTLKSGETMNGDLVVIGGVAVIEQDAKVEGSVVVIGGTLTIDGEVTTDTVLIGGTVSLGAAAYIHGDLVTVGGSLQRDKEARVDGEVVTNIPAPKISVPVPPDSPAVPEPLVTPAVNMGGNLLGRILSAIGRIVVVTALAMLSMLFLQPQAERVAHAIARQPVITGGVGFLTVMLAPVVVVILVVTLILIPVAAIVILALILAWLMGLIAIGLEVGQRFTAAVKLQWPVVLTAGFGTFLTITVMELIGLIPCVGWLISLLLGLMAVGGVLMTFFGSRQYPPVAAVLPSAPVPPASVQPPDGPVG